MSDEGGDFTPAETSEEPALASVDLDEDDGTGGVVGGEGDGTGASELTSEIEELERIIQSAQEANELLVAAQKTVVSDVLVKGGGGPDDDARSVFVSEVDFSVTADQLSDHFKPCGDILKVTTLKDKVTLRPKGYVIPLLSARISRPPFLLPSLSRCAFFPSLKQISLWYPCLSPPADFRSSAYIMFKDVESVQNALKLNGSEFHGRILKVRHKYGRVLFIESECS